MQDIILGSGDNNSFAKALEGGFSTINIENLQNSNVFVILGYYSIHCGWIYLEEEILPIKRLINILPHEY